MRAYIIEYRKLDRISGIWSSKISQEGYSTLEAARDYIEDRPGHIVQSGPMCFITEFSEEYVIHDIHITA